MSNIPNLPKAADIIRQIELLNFTWKFETQFDISSVDIDTRVQVRNGSNVAPKEMVDLYAVSMKYDQFPPIVVTSDNKVIDGNTRVAAKKKMGGDVFLPAIVIKTDFNKADGQTQLKLTHLGYRLNGTNGKPLDKAELLRHARIMLNLGLRVEEIGKDGINENQINNLKREMAAEDKLKTAGVNIKFDEESCQWNVDGEQVKATTLRALGKQQNLNLPTAPFRELADLAVKAQLRDCEITALSKAAVDTGSESGMLDTIRHERTHLNDRINEVALTKKLPKKSNSDMLRMWLTALAKLKGSEDTAVETDPNLTGERLNLIDTAAAVLSEIRRLQSL